jgi:hypothetical protein
VILPSDRLTAFYSGGTEIIYRDPATLEGTIVQAKPDYILWDTDSGPLPEPIKALSAGGVIEQIQTIRGGRDNSIVIYRIKRTDTRPTARSLLRCAGHSMREQWQADRRRTSPRRPERATAPFSQTDTQARSRCISRNKSSAHQIGKTRRRKKTFAAPTRPAFRAVPAA